MTTVSVSGPVTGEELAALLAVVVRRDAAAGGRGDRASACDPVWQWRRARQAVIRPTR